MNKKHLIFAIVGFSLFSLFIFGMTFVIPGGDRHGPDINIDLLPEDECIIEDVFWNDTAQICQSFPPQPDTSDELSTQYVPSDLNNAFSNYEVIQTGAVSWSATDVKKVKSEIAYTIKGTVVSISQPMAWNIPPVESESYIQTRGEDIRILVGIEVEKSKKAKNSNLPDLEIGSIYTVSITGKLKDNVIDLEPDEEHYQIGEKVIVHVAKDSTDNVSEDGSYVKLAKYGKYKIQNDKAYNDKNTNGKSTHSAFDEVH